MSTDLTTKDFQVILSDLYKNTEKEQAREFIMMTGIGGMQLFNNAMKKEAEEQIIRQRRIDADFKVSKLKVGDKITYEEWRNLKGMIKSPDLENLTIVESIIEHYEQR
jgi:hypothetical protein